MIQLRACFPVSNSPGPAAGAILDGIMADAFDTAGDRSRPARPPRSRSSCAAIATALQTRRSRTGSRSFGGNR